MADIDVAAITDGITGFIGWVSDNPLAAALILGGILLVLAVRAARNRGTSTDPVRMFSGPQRAEGFARADNRCELAGLLPFLRCSRSAEHGDHYYPWSKGGATSMRNFVAACGTCNLRKSNRIPSAALTWMISRRRRRYFPEGIPLTPGERYV